MRLVLSARQSSIRSRHRLVGDVGAALAKLTTCFHSRGVAKSGCVLVWLLIAMVAIAQSAQATALLTSATDTPASATGAPAQTSSAAPASGKALAAPPKISYIDGQLRISVLNSTLADVLNQVAALTGVKLDVPAGADSERMPVVELGPGPARHVLAALLSESTFDYVIQSSATDPEQMQSVLLMPRETKGVKANGGDLAARPSRSSYSRAAAPPAEPIESPASEAPFTVQPGSTAPDPNSSNPQPPPTQPDVSTPLPSTQPSQSSLMRPGAMTPPVSLSPQSMSQQLQQMYQQRMQMVQQDRLTGQQSSPANPGNN